MEIPEIPLLLAPESDAARSVIGFKWAGGNVGHRNKLGGKPDWLQGRSVQIPTCCGGKDMTFYGQLDSLGDQIALADVGMIFVFVCFDCFTTKSILQSG